MGAICALPPSPQFIPVAIPPGCSSLHCSLIRERNPELYSYPMLPAAMGMGKPGSPYPDADASRKLGEVRTVQDRMGRKKRGSELCGRRYRVGL